ncbi:histone-lysine N-methyltransferase SETMAR [Elysia marginata]|uniref:Histone-lysine N-methyltransferase SETMAR n=1 Tax=Elysia marginata TaxID=1093978 RepID=A0AAV4F1Z7_9GAST|nr:histone-lysine N-methyltransferase SETMAR [Elysia marginata]
MSLVDKDKPYDAERDNVNLPLARVHERHFMKLFPPTKDGGKSRRQFEAMSTSEPADPGANVSPSRQRMLLSSAVFLVVSLVIYANIFTLLTVVFVLTLAWYALDLIRQHYKEKIDPSGKYVFITGCDSGFGLESAKAIRDLGFMVIAGCYNDNSPGAKELKARPWVKKVEVVSLDVSNEASVMACAEEVKAICSDQDREGRGRSITATSEDNVKRVDELIRQDRRLKLHEIASSLEILETSAHRIVFDELGHRKVSARWVPKRLTDNHKEQRLDICRELLRRSKSSLRVHGHTANAGGDFLGYDVTFLDSIVTGDETWLHHCTPETKQDSNTWNHPSSPVAKKFKVMRPAKKIMGTVFWDSRGVLLFETLQPGETINTARYCQTLDKLREAIRRKRPGQLTNRVILQHDNATPHTARVTQGWLEKYGWEILPHPPHCPDLAPSDYHLFGPTETRAGRKAL